LTLQGRIVSRHGHLSNEAAAEVAVQIVSAELQHLYLGHLSGDCNRPELAHRVVSQGLAKTGATHVHVQVASQETPCPTLVLGGETQSASHEISSIPLAAAGSALS
jgi:hypothetical protein